MGYIVKNTSGLINTQITDTGRKYLSEGNFNIRLFQIGDSEVFYNSGITISSGFILEPSYNAQNSTAYPQQSNRENVKYPYYLEGSTGNTFGIPFPISTDISLFNYTDMLGFFTSAATNTYIVDINQPFSLSPNYSFNYFDILSGVTIDLDYSQCNQSTTVPQENQFISLYFDFLGDCNPYGTFPVLTFKIMSTNNPPTPPGVTCLCYTYNMTGSSAVIGIIYSTDCNSTQQTIPVQGGDSSTFCALQGVVSLDYDNNSYTYPNFGPLITEGSSCTPSGSAWSCGSNSLITLDRDLPSFNGYCDGGGRALLYASGMTPNFDQLTPQEYFALPCYTASTVPIWNMNIPWSESLAGVVSSTHEDYIKYGSINYIGTKEYLGYQTDNGQFFMNETGFTSITQTYFVNSSGTKIFVNPNEQKSIAIVSYTNTSINNYYGEKFAVEPYDPLNDGQEGQARNFKVVLPTLMWHKSKNNVMGQTFYIDPPNFDGLELCAPNYMKSRKDVYFNSPGMRYYHLWDTNPNADGYPNRVGKVFPDSKLVVFDDDEIIAAMSYKSNRNWTLPSPQINLLAPNLCTGSIDSIGVLADSTETLYVTYRFDSSSISSLHCNYYNHIVGPTDSSQSMNVTVRFGNEFGFMKTNQCDLFSATSMKILVQKVVTGTKPKPESWYEIDVTNDLSPYIINGYITPAGLTGTTFVISQNDYTAATQYNLANYINIPKINQPDLLNFGDEYYFYGNLVSDIQATIYEMKYAVNLQSGQFTQSSNPTSISALSKYISEIGLYNDKKELMILSKLQYPVLRQGIQQFVVKYDF